MKSSKYPNYLSSIERGCRGFEDVMSYLLSLLRLSITLVLLLVYFVLERLRVRRLAVHPCISGVHN